MFSMFINRPTPIINVHILQRPKDTHCIETNRYICQRTLHKPSTAQPKLQRKISLQQRARLCWATDLTRIPRMPCFPLQYTSHTGRAFRK